MTKHRVARIVFPLLLLAAGLPFVACGGEQSCDDSNCGSTYICDSEVDITAAVPPIQQETWTVKGCLDASCNSVQLDANTSSARDGSLLVELDSEAGAWTLVSHLADGAPLDGRAWSLTVTDSQGNVIVQGNGTAHTTAGSGGCEHVPITLP